MKSSTEFTVNYWIKKMTWSKSCISSNSLRLCYVNLSVKIFDHIFCSEYIFSGDGYYADDASISKKRTLSSN